MNLPRLPRVPRFRLAAATLLALALPALAADPATNAPTALARRVYPWTPALAELPYLGLDDPERAPGDALRAFAEGFGVAFPEGSWVKALPEAGRIVAMSDEPSLDAFGALLDCLEKAVHDRIEVSFAVLSVDAGDLAPMLERIGATNAAPGGAAAAAPPVLATAPSLGDLFARVGCDWTNRFAVPLSTRNVGWDRTASFGGFRSGGVSRPAGRSWAFEETAGGGRAVVPREAGGTVLHRNGPRLEAVPARIAGERDALRLEIRYEESDRFLGCERPDPSVGLPTRAADGSFALRPAPFEEVAMRSTPTSRSFSLPLRLRDGEAVLLRPAVPPEPLSGARAIPLRVPVVSARRLPEVGEPVEPGPFGLNDEVTIFVTITNLNDMELQLSRKIAEKRVFPAIDITRSGTRHEELLTSPEELQKMWILRKVVHSMGETEAMEFLIDKLLLTKTNDEFFKAMKTGG